VKIVESHNILVATRYECQSFLAKLVRKCGATTAFNKNFDSYFLGAASDMASMVYDAVGASPYD
jgi:hypothetical protein